MNAPTTTREVAETAGQWSGIDRWLAVSAPLAIDDDPDWVERDEGRPDEAAA
jgi:hypothetical protein